jgi:hypothetical protein
MSVKTFAEYRLFRSINDRTGEYVYSVHLAKVDLDTGEVVDWSCMPDGLSFQEQQSPYLAAHEYVRSLTCPVLDSDTGEVVEPPIETDIAINISTGKKDE